MAHQALSSATHPFRSHTFGRREAPSLEARQARTAKQLKTLVTPSGRATDPNMKAWDTEPPKSKVSQPTIGCRAMTHAWSGHARRSPNRCQTPCTAWKKRRSHRNIGPGAQRVPSGFKVRQMTAEAAGLPPWLPSASFDNFLTSFYAENRFGSSGQGRNRRRWRTLER